MRLKRQKKQKVPTFHKYLKDFKLPGEKIAGAGRQESIIRNNRKYRAHSKPKDTGRVSERNGKHDIWEGLKVGRIKCLERNQFCSGIDGSNELVWALFCFPQAP